MSDSPVVSHTIVIGAGPAGLAVGACLKQLESYAQISKVDIRFRQQVISARCENDEWQVESKLA